MNLNEFLIRSLSLVFCALMPTSSAIKRAGK